MTSISQQNANYRLYGPFIRTLSICGYLFSAIYIFMYQAYLAALFMFTGPTIAVLYSMISKENFKTNLTGYILLSIIFYTLAGSALFTGAHLSSAIWWYSLLPVTAGLFFNRKTAIFFMGLSVFTVLSQYLLVTKTNLIVNEFSGHNTTSSLIMSIIALNLALTTLTLVYINMNDQINKEKKVLQEKITKEKVNNAFHQGIFENAQNTLHIMGNNLTLLKSNMELMSKEDHIKKIIDVTELYDKQLNNDKENEKFKKYLNFLIESLEEVSIRNKEQTRTSTKKIENIIETIESMKHQEVNDVKENISLSNFISSIIEDMNKKLKDENIHVDKKIDNMISLFVDPLRLEQAIRVSIDNSIDAIITKKKQKIGKGSGNEDSNYQPKIILEAKEIETSFVVNIKDNGIGISEENKNDIFKLGFSTKDKGGGYNLHNTANYIKSVGGDINLSPAQSSGAILQMIFPK